MSLREVTSESQSKSATEQRSWCAGTGSIINAGLSEGFSNLVSWQSKQNAAAAELVREHAV